MLEVYPDFVAAGAWLETSIQSRHLQQNMEETWQLCKLNEKLFLSVPGDSASKQEKHDKFKVYYGLNAFP